MSELLPRIWTLMVITQEMVLHECGMRGECAATTSVR
jgi:hypothetical protein